MSRYIDADAFISEKREQYCKECERREGKRNGKKTILYEIGEVPCKSCELNDALDDLDDYPEADVDPVVHAHWIYKGDSHYGLNDWSHRFECSVCEREVKLHTKKDIAEFPYCHCGARMDEEVKDNE